MTSTERQFTRHGADRKAELLRGAEALFLERGYAATRMIDIAGAAGVAKGLVYWYFANKEALFAEIVADARERLRAAQVEALRTVDDPLSKLYVGTVESVRFILEHHRLFQLIWTVSNSEGLHEATAESARVHALDSATLLTAGQQWGLVRSDDTALAMAIMDAGVVDRVTAAYTIGAFGTDPDAAAHAAARYVVRAVAVDEMTAERVIAAHDQA